MNKTIRKIVIAVIALITIVSVSGITPATAQTITPVTAPAFNFTRSLTIGSTGEDVRALQRFLNDRNFIVAITGAGSPGNESTRFGPRTQAALARFQVANNISPARGFFGPITRARIMALATPAPVIPLPAGLAVSLAPDSPVSTTLIAGQASAELARFRFTNNDDREARVTQMALTRTGTSTDTTLRAVYLYDGTRRLTDLASVLIGRINFVNEAGLFTIPAGGSRTISVRSDILTATQGQTIGVSLSIADVRANVAIPTGALPISGNLMSIVAANFDLATVSVAAPSISPTTIDASRATNPVDVWQSTLTIGTRAINLHSLQLRQTGSIRPNDLQSFRLFVRGVQVGTASTLAADNTVTFDLSAAPVSLTTGPVALIVRANVVSGSNRTFSFALRQATDLNVQDSEFRVNVLATVATNLTFPITSPTTGAHTVGASNLIIAPDLVRPNSMVTAGASDVPVARYTLTAFGEPIRVKRFKINISGPLLDFTPEAITIRNIRLMANGAQIGLPVNIKVRHLSETIYELREGLTVVPGTPVTLEVRADIFDLEGTNDISSGDNFTFRLLDGVNDAQAPESLSLINIAPPAGIFGSFSFTVR